MAGPYTNCKGWTSYHLKSPWAISTCRIWIIGTPNIPPIGEQKALQCSKLPWILGTPNFQSLKLWFTCHGQNTLWGVIIHCGGLWEFHTNLWVLRYWTKQDYTYSWADRYKWYNLFNHYFNYSIVIQNGDNIKIHCLMVKSPFCSWSDPHVWIRQLCQIREEVMINCQIISRIWIMDE